MTSTQTGKEGAVSAAMEALRKAMIAADRSALEKLAAAELSYGHSGGRLENKAGGLRPGPLRPGRTTLTR